MLKILSLLLTISLALGSVAGFWYLTLRIKSGEREMTSGYQYVDSLNPGIEIGKTELKAGKEKLLKGKNKYEHFADKRFLVFADNVLNRGKSFRNAREKIAQGERNVRHGEHRLRTGELKLSRGAELLALARKTRVACVVGTVLFVALSLVIMLFWRRSTLSSNPGQT